LLHSITLQIKNNITTTKYMYFPSDIYTMMTVAPYITFRITTAPFHTHLDLSLIQSLTAVSHSWVI